MFDVEPPRSMAALSAALEQLNGEITATLEPWPTERLLRPQGTAWSPADHLRHLTKSMRPVAMAMGLPRLLLALRFGVSFRGSRSFEQVRDIYQQALADGSAQAGRFAPSARQAEVPPEEWRQQVMARWQEAANDLAGALRRWPEGALDRYRLPHPVLGKLTLREMLFFTVVHNAHHANRVMERAAAEDAA